ncbi:MAG: DEAD/DEAH box helicase [Chloroflexi bacterium]|nr:DEAD/DEAH box helicase [Chloroflexota bacterium]
MSLAALLSHWRSDPTIGGNIAAWETIPARAATFVPFPNDLHEGLAQALKRSGISALYCHQKDAWDQIRAGRHIVLATHTASGKTLAYNLPVLDFLLRSPEGRAQYLFPTKALAQDQLAGISELLAVDSDQSFSIAPATYDGDTSQSARAAIRRKSRLVISNPDMLHIGILPRHTAWADFFRNLRYVVIDEMHVYRGVFGSHVANVLRRLKRIARFYGSEPQFILTSATIGNPAELAQELIEEPVALIADDASARGAKHFLLYNPPIVDPELGLRASMLAESVRLADDLLSYDLQTIVFGRTRRTVEVMLRYLRTSPSPPLPPSPNAGRGRGGRVEHGEGRGVRAYRSGYLPEHRREIERGLREGEARAVVTTTALELGIDIGGMTATVQAGYPGTIAGTWQQAGRAGRGREASLSVLVAGPSPSDQFLARHPEYFFQRSPEHALINADNLLILLKHLQCAAFELPFRDGEAFGNVAPAQVTEMLNFLHEGGILHKSRDRFYWMGDHYPSADISLRSASAHPILLKSNAETIGEVESEAAPWMAHPGAIYLHEGETYLVETLDLENHLAILQPTQVDYFTRPRRETEIRLLDLREVEAIPGGSKAHGELAVISRVSGFHMIRWESHEKLGFRELELPPNELLTAGYWLSLYEQVVADLRAEGLWGSDRNDYGSNWGAQRQAALERDAYSCQVCGAIEGEISHHVHHKIPFKAFDIPREANRLENLITVCPACHQRVESAVRVRSGLSGAAYALGHLAPLFLMCDARDLGVHSDPRSSLADSGAGPVIVIYEMIPAGIGFSQRLYECHDELIRHARELIGNCKCSDGCPSCVGPGGEEGSGGKAETLAILSRLSSPNG